MAITMTDIRGMLEAEGLKYLIDPNRPLCFFAVTGLSGTFQVVIALELEGQLLQLRTIRYAVCSAEQPAFPALARALVELNGQHRFVKYSWDPSDGEVVVYGDHWIMDGTVTREQFRRMLGNFLPVIDQSFRRISQIIGTGTDPGNTNLVAVLRSLESKGGLDAALKDLLDKLSGGEEAGPAAPEITV